MRHTSLIAFKEAAPTVLRSKGPYAILLVEDDVEVTSTIAHLHDCGFSEVIAFGHGDILDQITNEAHLVSFDLHKEGAFADAINTVIALCPGIWLHYCYNAEYLFFPFCENRSIAELTLFNTEERRDTIFTYVIDLYSNDLGADRNAVSRERAHFDKAGYYALQRIDEEGSALERQMDVFGGLRWRFEEHVPWTKRRIDRISLFRAYPGLKLNGDHTFNDTEYNTISCPWHHNTTAALCSFRTAKALMSNPGSQFTIPHFWWSHSEKFDWSSTQLMDHGLMEPGQWF